MLVILDILAQHPNVVMDDSVEKNERNRGWQAYKAQLAQMGWKLEKIVKTTLLSLVLFLTVLCQYLTVCVLEKNNHVTDGKWRLAFNLLYYMMSMYPLPMNHNKKGYRFPGRKMSAGAFQKLLVRISLQGIDVTKPIDLKEHWEKHGTNRVRGEKVSDWIEIF